MSNNPLWCPVCGVSHKVSAASMCPICHIAHIDQEEHHQFSYVDTEETLLEADIVDPITLEPYYDPVSTPCRHTFSCRTIQQCKKCPLCKVPFSLKDLKPSVFVVINLANKLKVTC